MIETNARVGRGVGVWAPIAALTVLSPMLAELTSGAMSPSDFLMPQVFLPFTTIVYGLPVLALREIAARSGLGVLGLWVLGMTYGLYNEGLFSETFYYGLDFPNPEYAGYGLVQGLQVPWMCFIVPWHGLFSVVLPVLLVDALFPRHRGRPWLPAKGAVVLTVVVASAALARFVLAGEDRTVHGGAVFAFHVAVVCLLAVGFAVAAAKLPRVPQVVPGRPGRARLWRAFAIGAGLYAFGFLGMDALALSRPPWLLVIGYAVVVGSAAAWAASRIRRIEGATALAFALGATTLQAMVVPVTALGIFGGDAQRLVIGVVIASFGLLAMARMGRRSELTRHDGSIRPAD